MIDHDASSRSIVTVCRKCGSREVHVTATSAQAWQVDHLERVHPEDRARRLTAARVAAHRAATRRE